VPCGNASTGIYETASSHYLTEQGKAGIRKLIKEEGRAEDKWRRERLEWKIKLIVSIATAVTGLAGAIIGIIAILKK
jgi:type IV secretory pathway component VirB8